MADCKKIVELSAKRESIERQIRGLKVRYPEEVITSYAVCMRNRGSYSYSEYWSSIVDVSEDEVEMLLGLRLKKINEGLAIYGH